MDARLEQFRAGAADVGERRAGRKFPRELKMLAGEYARARRDDDASWQEIAAELGVTLATVRRWSEDGERIAAGFKAVRVVDAPRRETLVVTIGALRVDGLAFESLVALAKALS
jgi:predicted transcriptional regulator